MNVQSRRKKKKLLDANEQAIPASSKQEKQPDELPTPSDLELELILAEHRSWLESEGRVGAQANLSRKNLGNKENRFHPYAKRLAGN